MFTDGMGRRKTIRLGKVSMRQSEAFKAKAETLLAAKNTGSLDAETGTRVLDLLVGLARTGWRTMVVVTHSDAVARAADRVLAIRDGRLVEETVPGGGTA